MEQRSSWSKDQIDLTREILKRVDIVAFSFSLSKRNKGCTLNNLDGRYGYITIEDALSDNWRVFDYWTDQPTGTYASIDDVIEHGWKVNT